MKNKIILLVVGGFFISIRAMDDEVNFKFNDTSLCLEAPQNWHGLKEGDELSFKYFAREIKSFGKDKQLKHQIKIEANKLKEGIPENYDMSRYNEESWNIYPLILSTRKTDKDVKEDYNIVSWKMVRVQIKHEANRSYFELSFLFKERDYILLP